MSRTPAKTAEANTKAYLRTKIMTAGPAELRMMLFDGALRFAENLLELINGLQPEQDPALCERLSGLYTFMYTRLIDASQERSAEIVKEVIKLLEYERKTWSMLLEKLAEEKSEGGPQPSDGPVSLAG
ncbi:MAG: flagellar export chaperone FliS [Planctomycetota bacterium]|jgi:flagellar protein FliS